MEALRHPGHIHPELGRDLRSAPLPDASFKVSGTRGAREVILVVVSSMVLT